MAEPPTDQRPADGAASENPEPSLAGGSGFVAFLLATVFCSGCAIMIVEMTAVRLLQPFFGSTNIVWTNVIGVVMAALAVGYAVGGRLADRRPFAKVLYGLLAAGGLVVLLTAPLTTPIAEWLLPVEMHVEGVAGTLGRGSLAASIILFAPATLLLGMISPLAVRLLATGGVGRAAGRVFAIGTVGSIVGTYLPTYVLIPEFGSRRTMLIAAVLLLIPAVIGLALTWRRRGTAAALVVLVVALPVGALTSAAPGRSLPPLPGDRDGVAHLLAEGESPYQYVTVREDRFENGEAWRLMTLNEGVYTYHSFEVLGQVLTGSRYYDDYAVLPMLLDVPRGAELRAAIVGLAGGIFPHQWKHFWDGVYDLHVDGAELDPLVLEYGRTHFHLPPSDSDWLSAYVMDGRQMLAAGRGAPGYHMIVVDAFTHELYIPFHLGTREFFELCKERLEPGGILAMNVYAYRPDSPNLLALQNTCAHVFGHAVQVRQSWGGNFVLMARNGAPPDLSRLAAMRVNARFGDRSEVAEWGDLITLASKIPGKSVILPHDPEGWLLTDDHAPLERLMDEMIDRAEAEARGP